MGSCYRYGEYRFKCSSKKLICMVLLQQNDWLISQSIDLGAGGNYAVNFDMAVTNYNGTTSQSTLSSHMVRIIVSTDNGQTWSAANVIKTYTGDGTYSNTGAAQSVSLAGYTGVVKIGILATTTSTSPDIDFHIDNFQVVAAPPVVTSFLPFGNLEKTVKHLLLLQG